MVEVSFALRRTYRPRFGLAILPQRSRDATFESRRGSVPAPDLSIRAAFADRDPEDSCTAAEMIAAPARPVRR